MTLQVKSTEWRAAPAPATRSLVVIGDVHGRSHLLGALVGQISDVAQADTHLVYIGDLIDPHPQRDEPHNCAAVLDIAATPVANVSEIDYLAGNHDAFFLIALDAARKGTSLPWPDGLWSEQGGIETAVAWGVLAPEGEAAIAHAIWSRMTIRQRSVFESMKVFVEHDSYLLVHAGFEPHVLLDRQMARANILEFPDGQNEQQNPLWMRFKAGTDTAPKGRVLIHGHTPTRRPILGRKRICIDTGAKYGGPLTALEIVGDRMRLHQAWPAGMTPERWHKDGLR
jgi:serine/threonine protein phosphatase 1